MTNKNYTKVFSASPQNTFYQNKMLKLYIDVSYIKSKRLLNYNNKLLS
ncbi:hypothetical protein OD91_2216 [Lutibacter sp. Hel_I_33_5]|nr:hypothetical protein OD91_2216 [Lutibacter sp. Hel_I_33_5]